MKKLVIPALLAVLVLTGCTSGGADASPPSAATIPSATPTPTPTVMTTAEAGAKYLSIVCPANKAGAVLNDALSAGNLDQIVAAAPAARDAFRTSAVALADTSIRWPDGVATELKKLSDSQFASVAWAEALTKAKSLDEVRALALADDGSAVVAQKVRAQLGLPASTTCE